MANALLISSARATLIDSALTEGDVAPLGITPSGRLRVSSKQATFDPSVGNLVLLNDALNVDVSEASNLVLHVKNTGTASMAAGVFAFEGSVNSTNGVDGDWFVIQAVRTDSNTVETGRAASSLAAGVAQAYGWELSVQGLKWFRVRCSTAVTASSIATWTVIRGSYATEPIPAMQTHAVTQSGAWTATNTPVTPTAYSVVTAASTNAASVKASAGTLFGLVISNVTATAMYVKLYNKNASPTVGTDVPLLTIAVAANATLVFEFGSIGKRFTAGIAIAVTAAAAATDTAVTVAGAQISLDYI